MALHIRWLEYCSFNISPSNEYSGLITFRTDWFDLHAVQGTLKSLLQHHNSKASVLWGSVFFMVQLSHPHMTAGKTMALVIRVCQRSEVSGKTMALVIRVCQQSEVSGKTMALVIRVCQRSEVSAF